MNEEAQAGELERAILGQAEALATARLERASAEQARIREAGERRRSEAEARLIARTRGEAERLYKRRVQAAEIGLQGDLDRLRATLVEQVLADVRTRLGRLAEDPAAYLPVLEGLLAAACSALPGDALRARLNARDHQRFGPRWPELAARIAPGRQLRLDDACCAASGGGLVGTADGTRRVDNTFEGRLLRLQASLARVALEALSGNGSWT